MTGESALAARGEREPMPSKKAAYQFILKELPTTNVSARKGEIPLTPRAKCALHIGRPS